jgi:hypothetical protein
MSIDSKLPSIPITSTDILNQQKIIIQTLGIGLIKTAIFDHTIPKPETKTGEIGRDAPLYSSSIGNPVFSNFNVQAGSYTKNGQNFSFDEIKIDVALFEVNYPKNIITTPIQGRDGTVKEYISDGDFQVNIRGILFAPNNTFPLDDFVALIKVAKAPVPLKINSWYLEKFGIYNLVVTEASFRQEPGKFSQQFFEISAISDTPIELNISK